MFGGSPKCPVCSKAVYFNERVHAMGEDFHKDCFKCTNCNKRLELGKQHEHDGQLFCQPCHGKLFGPKGYGFGGGAGVLTDTGLDKDGNKVDYRQNKGAIPPPEEPKSAGSSSGKSSPFSRFSLKFGGSGGGSGGSGCPRCGKSVGFAEKLIALDATYHKDCFTCKSCSKRLNAGEYSQHDGEPYCKTCHSKEFGPKGYGYGGAVLAANH